MVWIVSDEAMEHLLGGDFTDVAMVHDECNEMTVSKLFPFQNSYRSYQGFRKFFRKHMEPILGMVRYIEDNSLVSNALKYFARM